MGRGGGGGVGEGGEIEGGIEDRELEGVLGKEYGRVGVRGEKGGGG